jgi:hypothetical protein
MQYFTRDGRPLSEREALDENGVLKDGVKVRVGLQDAAMHRPGFRSMTSGTVLDRVLARDAKAEANAAHRHYLENAWRTPAKLADATEEEEDDADGKICLACQGTGETQSGSVCPACNGEGFLDAATATPRVDHRSVADIATEHRRTMDKIYQEIADATANEWRRGK